ncbi:MAG: prolipoprotein diacylglyceryl transferase [Flavobacteriales bacterium]
MTIEWDIDPAIFKIGELEIRWYGLLFALSFMLGHMIVKKMFDREGVKEEWLDKLLIYVIIGTVIGARLGHVFFYGWDYYSEHLAEIPQIWEGGLASHGGAIGIIIALWIYSKKVTNESILWILDRVVVPVALAGCFIRFGNLLNSEIVGKPTDVSWAFIFVRLKEVPPVPRHPSQIYESVSYLVIFFVLMYMYWKKSSGEKRGLLFGTFLVLIFTARFFIEFFKANQEAFEQNLPLNMGQLLSIPFVIIGVYFVWRSLNGKSS